METRLNVFRYVFLHSIASFYTNLFSFQQELLFKTTHFNVPLQKPRSETVRGSLRLLTSSAYRLQSECRKALPSEGCPGPDMQLVTQQVIQCAYDIAKAAKQLVTITTKENTN